MDHLSVPRVAEMEGGDLKLALRQADKQQIAVRRVKQAQSWNSSSTYVAFEEPEPTPTSRVRGALRRQTQKLKQKTIKGLKRETNPGEAQLVRQFSFEFNDDLEKRHDPRFVLAEGACQSLKHLDTKTQLRIVKAQHRARRLAEKATEKEKRRQEKELRKRLKRELKNSIAQPVDVISRGSQRRVLRRTRPGNADLAFLDAKRHHEKDRSIDPVSWPSPATTPVSVSVLGPGSPVSDFEPIDRALSSPSWRSPLRSPAARRNKPISSTSVALPTVVEDAGVVDLPPSHSPALSELDAPNRPPEYVEVPAELSKDDEVAEPFVDLPEEPRPASKASIRCDKCSATISLSSNFFYCNTCGPQGGLLCRGCMHDGKTCLSGVHVLESSKQLVRKACPRSESYNPPSGLSRAAPSYEVGIKTDETLAAISSETTAQSLSLARLQKAVEKINSAAALHHKELVQHVKDVMSDQRNETMQQVEYVLQEIKTERTEVLGEVKQISAPSPAAARAEPAMVPDWDGRTEDRQLTLREREMAYRERELALEERRLARIEISTRSQTVNKSLPRQVLALGSSVTNELPMMEGILQRLKKIEDTITSTKMAQPQEEPVPGLTEEVVVRALNRLSINSTTGITTHAGTKRRASSAAVQHTPATSQSTSDPSSRPPTESNDSFPDEDASEDESPKRRKQSKSKSPDVPPVLLACPFTKYDFHRYSDRNRAEKGYRGCSSCYITDISRLKQHLYRVHQRPDHYCARCYEVFKGKAMLDNHMRRGIVCATKVCPFPEKIQDEKLGQIRKKWPSKSTTESWYHIYRILFPGLRPPPSPYAEELATGHGPSISTSTSDQWQPSPRIVQDVVQEQLERANLAVPPRWSPSSPEHAFLVQFGHNVAAEVLRRISASPTPVTSSAPNSALPEATGSPGPEMALDGRGDVVETGLFGPDFDDQFSQCFFDTTLDGQLRSDPADDAPGPGTGLSHQPRDVVVAMPDLLDVLADDLLVDTSPSPALRASCSKRSNDSGYGSMLTRDDPITSRGHDEATEETTLPYNSTDDLSFLDNGLYETLDVDLNMNMAGCFEGVDSGREQPL